MISDELLAAIAECDVADAHRVLTKLKERVGRDLLRDAYLSATQERGRESEGPHLLQVAEFLRVVGEPPPMLVEEMLPEKSLVLVTGKPKAGKSFLALDVMDAVCQNLPVFGRFAVNHPGPVCYIGMEDGQYEIANRLMGRGIRTIDDSRPLYVSADRFTLSHPDSLAYLEAMIAPVHPVLLVIDTAREALGIRDWNAAAEVADAIRPIRDFARRFCTVVLVAHNRKGQAEDAGDEISGSNALTSSVDGWISAYKVEKMDGGNRRLHLSVTGRGGMRGEFVVEMDTDTTRFRALTDEEVSGEKAAVEREMRMRRYMPIIQALDRLPNNEGTVPEIAAEANKEMRTAFNIVKDMLKDGEIEETGQKRAPQGPGKPAPIYRRSTF